jgi:hypothetical protein
MKQLTSVTWVPVRVHKARFLPDRVDRPTTHAASTVPSAGWCVSGWNSPSPLKTMVAWLGRAP